MRVDFTRAIAIRLTIVTTLSFAACRACADEWAEAEKIQLQCEEYRLRNFQAGHVQLRQVEEKGDREAAASGGRGQVLSIWFDGDCLRTDAEQQAGGPVQAIVCNEIWIRSLDDSTPVTVAPVAEYGNSEEAIRKLGLVHPRWLGMGPNPLGRLSSGRQARALYFPDRTAPGEAVPKLQDMQLDGVNVIQIAFRNSGEAVARLNADSSARKHRFEVHRLIWIAPDQGFALLRFELRTAYPDAHIEMLSKVENSFQVEPVSGVWYPRESRRSFSHNGELRSSETTTVETISFGRPAVEDFQLAGLGLTSGRKITDRTQGAREVDALWDGTQAVRIPKPRDLVRALVPAKATGRNWLLWGNAAVLASIGGYLLWKRRRQVQK